MIMSIKESLINLKYIKFVTINLANNLEIHFHEKGHLIIIMDSREEAIRWLKLINLKSKTRNI